MPSSSIATKRDPVALAAELRPLLARNAAQVEHDRRLCDENVNAIAALAIQCAELPRLWPFERTRFGNTSPMYTQITDPWEMAKNPIYATSSQTR